MGKYKYRLNDRHIAKRLAEGRGAGEGEAYKPFLKTRDVPSLGRRARILGRTTGRVHHLLSDLEARAFYEVDWDDAVVDIREQYPLPREVTQRIAEGLGFRHPRAPGTDVDSVITTDLLVTREEPAGRTLIPINVKYEADLASVRTTQKIEIERKYWALQGLQLETWTDERLPKERAETLAWLHAFHDVERKPFSEPGYWRRRGGELIDLLRRCPVNAPIASVVSRAEASGAYDEGEVLSLIRFLASAKLVKIDLDRRFDPRMPVSSIGLPCA